MRLSTRSRYGLRAMVLVARNKDVPVSSETVAECEKVSKKYLDRLLGMLRSAGLLRSHRGQGGGYTLARPSGTITVAEIVRALEHRPGLVPCLTDPDGCSKSRNCPTRAVWLSLSETIDTTLEGITLAHLTSGARSRIEEGCAHGNHEK